MKTLSHPFNDYAHEINAMHRARRRRRIAAFSGLVAFSLLIGFGLGVMAGHDAWRLIALVAISAWGCWGLNYLLTRH